MSDTPDTPLSSRPEIGGITTEEFLFLNRQLASILRLELPLTAGLRSMAAEVRKPNLRNLIDAVRADLEQGVPLTTALARYPRDFPPLYLEILRAGEESGDLATVLDELATYSQTMADTRVRIMQALTYPLVVGGLLLVVVVGVLLFVVPQFQNMFVGVETNALTTAVFAMSRFLLDAKLSIPIVGLVVVILLVLGFRVREGIRNVDDFIFRIPALGRLMWLGTLLKISRTFADLLRTGVGLVTALDLTANIAGNNRIRDTLLQMKTAVEEGRRFSEAAGQGGAFPQTMVWKLTMAEERGTVEDALEEMAHFYGRELTSECSHIENVMGPVMITAIAIVVGLIVIALYIPIFSLSSTLLR